MRTRDGVRLDADVYFPPATLKGPHPVLMMRQPYGRRIASTVTFAHPSWYAAHGYIVVIQDVRGRGTSEGVWRAFENEAADGADAVRWAATLPGVSGAVGMYGFSYQGATQLLAAGGLAAEDGTTGALKAIAPAMTGWRIHDDWAYEGGAFALAANVSWGLQTAAETARLARDEEAFVALARAAAAPPLRDAIPAVPDILRRYASYAHYMEWVGNPGNGPYWDRIAPAAQMGRADLPALHVGGWYDSFLAGTLAAYRELSARARSPQHLVVGPWTHLDWTGRHSAYDAGPAGANTIDALQLRWFDHWLKGAANWDAVERPVQLFDMGANVWRGFERWDAAPSHALHLASDGRAALMPCAGRLTDVAGPPGANVVVLDPWRPPPSHGGHAAPPVGRVDRAAIDDRPDVCAYTTEPLSGPLRLAGAVAAELWVQADQSSFDVSAVLSELRPDGKVVNLTQGYRRVAPGEGAAPLRVEMRGTAATIPAGTALRLSLAPSCFPAFPVNGGDGAPPAVARRIDQRIVTLTIRHGSGTPSRLLLPIVAEGSA